MRMPMISFQVCLARSWDMRRLRSRCPMYLMVDCKMRSAHSARLLPALGRPFVSGPATAATSRSRRATARAARRHATASARPAKPRFSTDQTSIVRRVKVANSIPSCRMPSSIASEIVSGCTCNGKNPFGLAKVDIRDDPTIRKGDLVAGRGWVDGSRAQRRQARRVAQSVACARGNPVPFRTRSCRGVGLTLSARRYSPEGKVFMFPYGNLVDRYALMCAAEYEAPFNEAGEFRCSSVS